MQDARLIRRRRVVLAALAGAVLALLAAAQPVTGSPAPVDDLVHANLDARLETLGSGERTKVIVQLEGPATPGRIAALERRVGALAITRRFSVIDGFAASATRRQIEALTHAPGVAQIEANTVVRGTNDEAQAAFGVSKARLDLPSLDGGGTTIAVLDSGVRADHLDLNQGKVVAFEDFTSPAVTPYDNNGHGTHVAAIAAGDGEASGGQFRGVAPAASIAAVKVLDASLQGSAGTVIAGIEWVLDHKAQYGIRIIVLSLQTNSASCSDGTDAVSAAVNNAHTEGVLVVVAAGNGGPGTCTIGAPAAAVNALTVGAMADTGEDGFRLAPFSSRGPTSDGRIKPDVVAPGVAITSAAVPPSGYETRSGTSMAAPFVAGVAALMLDANSGFSPQQLKDGIMSTAVDWGRGGDNTAAGSSGHDIDYGAGRLDAYAALRAAGAALSAPPPLPAHEMHQGTLLGTGAYVDHEVSITDTNFPVAATLIAPGAGPPDLDLALFNPSGTEVGASRTIGAIRQEQLSFQPTTAGIYTLRVSSQSGSGSYFVDVSGATSSQPRLGVPPSITGAVREGQLLRAHPGAWSGGLPLSFSFQWLRCDPAGGQCNPIPGIAGADYQLTSADIDAAIRVTVTATNKAGSASADSSLTGAVVPLPPRNVDPPSIVGTARDGNTLQAERGSWTSSRPIAVTHQWLRCQRPGVGCFAVAGATTPTFALGPPDIGLSLTVTVTAANAGGQESVTATPVTVGARRPESTALPVIAGSARAGVVLRAREGAWTGTRPLAYELRWQRCGYNGRGCETIASALGPRYRVRASDAGRRLRVRVRADNSRLPGGGVQLAFSGFTRIVQPAQAWFEAGVGRVSVLTGTRGRDVIMGTPGPDIIRGLGGNDRIDGRGGNDVILGGDGRDLLLGGKGDDTLHGGDGADTLDGGRGADLVSGGRGQDVAWRVKGPDRLKEIERVR